MHLRFEPYSFDLSAVNLVTNHSSWLYMNDLTKDQNMSVKLEGKVTAKGADDTNLSNFTAECAANDLYFWIDGNITADTVSPDENISAATPWADHHEQDLSCCQG